jgi:hypothetical protein
VSTIPRPGHDVPGRWETPRTPGRKTYGPAIAEVARAIGKPLQPWQRRVLDVGTELLPDGRWAYPIVCVTVMRQAGKTTLLGPKSLHRCLIRPRVKTWITAQSRQDARDVWSDIADLVDASPIRELWNVRRSNGSEALGAPTGSTFRVFAPTEDALHGKANEAVDVDEVWAFDGLEGDALEQAILPTFTTTGGQLWLVSNAGTLTSTWLRKYVDRGRAAVDSGANTGIAYFEWSLSPAEAAEVVELLDAVRRVDDEEQRDRLALDAVDLVMARHPGQYVQRHALVEPFKTMSPGEVLRAYGNVWTVTADDPRPPVARVPRHRRAGARPGRRPRARVRRHTRSGRLDRGELGRARAPGRALRRRARHPPGHRVAAEPDRRACGQVGRARGRVRSPRPESRRSRRA